MSAKPVGPKAELDYDRIHAAIQMVRDKQIFFVGGTIKSGTTWLQLLLNEHPEVSCNGEGHFPDHLARLLKQALDQHWQIVDDKNKGIFKGLAGYPRLREHDFLYILASCIALFLIEQSKDKPARTIGERTPDNLDYFALLDTLFPSAKFIQIVRDGRDCAVSGWFHNLRLTPEWTRTTFGSLNGFAKAFAAKWAADLAKAQEFADRHPDRVRQVRYEDLAANPEPALAALFDFLAVDTGNAVLVRCRENASFAKLTGGRSPGQENRLSFFRKGMPGDWRNHLSDEVQAEFRDKAGKWLAQFGYA